MKQTWTLIAILLLSATSGSLHFIETGRIDLIAVLLTIVSIVGLCSEESA